MDITQLFKASIKTIRLRNKSLPAPDKNRILKKSPKTDFTIKTLDICHQITQLKNLLIENRSAYMRFGCHLKSSTQMTDEERDIIDSESEKIISICTQFLNDLKLEVKRKVCSKQETEHMQNVLELLSAYLKNIFNIYNEQKAYRIQYELESYKLLKLESNKKLIPVIPPRERIGRLEYDEPADDGDGTYEENERHALDRKRTNRIESDDDIASRHALAQDEISAEDIQMFESENVQLYKELRGLSDEVEQIEKNVVDIARLQEIFTEKVSEQKADIDRIANTVVGATENVKDANEQIKQAIQRNAGLRVWVLFFLLVMSFSLLFLNWYND
ncbi:Syntaxin-18 [Pseudolycoriella hygida]|uniref:Syntaxin-18 n=1 Tax=Pseudolycoriella hygida TaxID=35572 RepID=A0A9Q0MU27_9DIPT|nr:Syntaxin-18 [Pseudolycoriella hygida]